jgi:hypothetical protein
MSPQTLLNPSFEAWGHHAAEGGFAPTGWTRALDGSANLVANGDFATNDLTSWTAAAGWAGTLGRAVHDGTIADTTPLTQNISLTTGHSYRISVRLSGRTAGTLALSLENVTTGPFAVGGYSEGTYEIVVLANATDATSLLALTPSATYDGGVDSISVRDIALSDIRICGDRAHLAPYPSLFGLDFAIDATPNVATLTGVGTLELSADYHLYFNHQWSHDDPAITDPDAHYATITIRTADSAHYLQADLTWGADPYAFPILSKAAMDRFSKRFTSLSDHTAYAVIFSSNDLHGSAGYLVHQYIDNLHCENVETLTPPVV